MKNLNEEIDNHIKKERRKIILPTIFGISLVIFVVSFLMLPTMGETTQVTGIVQRLIGLPTDTGEKSYIVVKLDSGREVRAYITSSTYYKQGKKVKLQKQEALFFGRTIYRFQGYENKH